MAKELLKPATVSNAKPAEKDKRLNDGNGLYLLIKTTGAKWWRLDYTIDSKRKTLSLGVYPATGLADARRKAEDARVKVANGIDPSAIRKETKAAKQIKAENQRRIDAGLPVLNSFEHVAREWLASIEHTVGETVHSNKVRRFELHAFPWIGRMEVAAVKSPDIYALLKPLIAKGQLPNAHRLHSEISAAFAYAIAHGFTDYDPAQAVAAQIPPYKAKHRAALTDQKEVGQMLRDIYNYQGTFVVQCAFKLSPLLFQRPGEIRQMEWKDIDTLAREWRPFVTKTDVLHIVPLSTQAIDILEAIKPLTGSGRYVFPNARSGTRPMSKGTIRTALKSLGYESDTMTAHGFRTTASTLLNEQGWSPDAIERQLCHMPRDQVRAAYNRAQYLDERRRMMQAWADYLDGLKNGAELITFKRTG
jgi:integrase